MHLNSLILPLIQWVTHCTQSTPKGKPKFQDTPVFISMESEFLSSDMWNRPSPAEDRKPLLSVFLQDCTEYCKNTTVRLAAYTVLPMKVAFSLMFSSGVGLMALVVSCGLRDPFSTSLRGRTFACHSHHPVIVQMDCGSFWQMLGNEIYHLNAD